VLRITSFFATGIHRLQSPFSSGTRPTEMRKLRKPKGLVHTTELLAPWLACFWNCRAPRSSTGVTGSSIANPQWPPQHRPRSSFTYKMDAMRLHPLDLRQKVLRLNGTAAGTGR